MIKEERKPAWLIAAILVGILVWIWIGKLVLWLVDVVRSHIS